MRFQPKSEKELAEDGLLPAGEYDFEVLKATEKTSKAGNEMIEVLHWAYGPDGEKSLVTDFLMEKIAYKLRHFASAVGLLADYESGNLSAASLAGRTGRFKLAVEASKDSQYPPKNTVKDYVVPKVAGEVVAVAAPVSAAADEGDTGIPF